MKNIKKFSFRVYFKSAVATRGCICEQKEKFGNESQFSRQKIDENFFPPHFLCVCDLNEDDKYRQVADEQFFNGTNEYKENYFS